MPEVSVNICCYNSEKFIHRSLESVLNQTYKDFEVIVIDDGSKDRTGEIIKGYKDPRIKYFYQENRGLSASRNRAIELSSGEYIALIDHDDIWLPEKLQKQIQLFRNKQGIDLVFSNCIVENEKKGKKSLFFLETENFHENPVGKFFERDYMPLLTVVFKKNIVRDIGGFSEEFISGMDYDFIFRFLKKYKFDYIREPLAIYVLHGANTLLQFSKKAYEEELQVINRHIGAFPEVVKKDQEKIRKKIAYVYALLTGENLLIDDYRTARKTLDKAFELGKVSPKVWIFNFLFRVSPKLAKYAYSFLKRKIKQGG